MLSESERRSLADYVRDAYGTDAFEIVGACQVLWSGWEGDTWAVLVDLSDGRRVWGMVDGVHVPADRIVSTLRGRITAYRQAIHETEALLMIAGELREVLGQSLLISMLDAVHGWHGRDPGVRDALLRVLRERTAAAGFELAAILDSGSKEAARVGAGLGTILRSVEGGGGAEDLLTRAYDRDRERWQALLTKVEADHR